MRFVHYIKNPDNAIKMLKGVRVFTMLPFAVLFLVSFYTGIGGVQFAHYSATGVDAVMTTLFIGLYQYRWLFILCAETMIISNIIIAKHMQPKMQLQRDTLQPEVTR
ncbi:hypothetical protein [Butyrivibrio proteoclasticus]|nr:hypothetical protein [Butyrivibrio proteoclasticus]